MNVTTIARSLISIIATTTAAVGVGAVALAAPASAHQAPSTTARAYTSAEADLFEERVQHQINKQRKNFGLRTLKADPCADQYAESWGSYLTTVLDLVHQSMGTVLNG